MKQAIIKYFILAIVAFMIVGCGGGSSSKKKNNSNTSNTNNTNTQNPVESNPNNLAAGFQEFREILEGTEGVTQAFLNDFNSNEANTLRSLFQNTQLFFEKVENQTDPSGLSGSFQNSELWTFCADGRFSVVFSNTTTGLGDPITDRQEADGVWDAAFTGEPTKRNVIFGHSTAPEVIAVNPRGFIPLIIDRLSVDTVRSGEKLYRRTSIVCN